MKQRFSALVVVVFSAMMIVGCSGPGPVVGRSTPAALPSLITSAPQARSQAMSSELAALFAKARLRGPLMVPSLGDKLPLTWGTQVPLHLYSELSTILGHRISERSASGQSVIAFVVVPKSPVHAGGRTVKDDGVCMLTVIGYQYPDHWEYAYSYYSGNCYFDGGAPPDGPDGVLGTPSPNTDCGVPQSAQGTQAADAINNSPALKNLTTFLANNHTLPTIKVDTTSTPVSDMTGKGIDATSDYARTPSQGVITLFQKGLAASGHPLDQVLYHEMLHFYFVYGQYDLTGASGTPILPTSGTASVTIGSVTYTYDLSDHSPNGGYQSYEHVLVHNAMIDAFGVDNTGALMEALNKTQPPLTNDQKAQILKDYASKKLSGSISATIPKGGQACGVTKYPSGRARVVASVRRTRDIFNDMAAVTFDSTYETTAAPATPPPAPPCTLDSYGFCAFKWYWANDTCYLPDSTAVIYDVGPDIYDIYSSAGKIDTVWVNRTLPDQYCNTYPDWNTSLEPAVTYGDPYLP